MIKVKIVISGTHNYSLRMCSLFIVKNIISYSVVIVQAGIVDKVESVLLICLSQI
jgi:hypothetical protein